MKQQYKYEMIEELAKERHSLMLTREEQRAMLVYAKDHYTKLREYPIHTMKGICFTLAEYLLRILMTEDRKYNGRKIETHHEKIKRVRRELGPVFKLEDIASTSGLIEYKPSSVNKYELWWPLTPDGRERRIKVLEMMIKRMDDE